MKQGRRTRVPFLRIIDGGKVVSSSKKKKKKRSAKSRKRRKGSSRDLLRDVHLDHVISDTVSSLWACAEEASTIDTDVADSLIYASITTMKYSLLPFRRSWLKIHKKELRELRRYRAYRVGLKRLKKSIREAELAFGEHV